MAEYVLNAHRDALGCWVDLNELAPMLGKSVQEVLESTPVIVAPGVDITEGPIKVSGSALAVILKDKPMLLMSYVALFRDLIVSPEKCTSCTGYYTDTEYKLVLAPTRNPPLGVILQPEGLSMDTDVKLHIVEE
jgi:hypothetical protein